MKTLLNFLGCLLLASFFVACSQSADKSVETDSRPPNEESDENWQPEMYEVSELVKVMRTMEEELKETRKSVIEGHGMKEMPAYYADIKTASATDPTEITPIYQAFADRYLADYNKAQQLEGVEQVAQFNNMVSTCVACHEEYCHGPIPKIKKLLIK